MPYRTTAIALSLITALAMSACNRGDEATEVAATTEPAPTTNDVKTTEPPPTTSTASTSTVLVRADVLALELVSCERFGIGTLVDPVVARGYLTDGQEPLIVQDSAPFALQAMSCDNLVTGEQLIYYGEFLHEPGWMGNVGTLQLGPGSAFEGLLGSEVTGPVNGDDVTVTMTVFRDGDD